MSQATNGLVQPGGIETNTYPTVVDTEGAMQTYFAALEDADCRAIMDATSEETLSAAELSEECDLPLSTTYRKIDKLVDADLLEERIRIRKSGKHTSEYVLGVDDLVVSVESSGGMTLRVTPRTDA